MGDVGEVKMAEDVLEEAMAMVIDQIPKQVCAGDLMSKTVCTCGPSDTMDHVLALMNRMQKKAVHVVSEDYELLGFIKYRDPVKAAQAGKGQQHAKAWMRKELVSVEADTPFAELEALLLEGSTGRLHVVDDDGRLIGLVSRTDLLRHHK